MQRILLFILFMGTLQAAISQAIQREVPSERTSLPVKIDGIINEEAWKKARVITDFVEMRPSFGKPENERTKTEVYLLYDDNAVYFGGMLYETSRDSISTQLTGRDEVGINDYAGIIFDTYQDKINGLGFYVTPLNEQFDLKYSIGDEDRSWNTVYQSETRITDEGWSFEMRIPYSAIRFSKSTVQNWNIHIIRRRSKTGQQFSWSPVDPAKFGFMNQAGTWTNLTNIKPPLRLSFSPYFSSYLSREPGGGWKKSLNGGMDVKIGITDGFTMDMTLIPDFGQVQSDNQVLNLSPFEVQFNENRSFFTEGTELFNKGNLFYSRRIGGRPIHYYQPGANETVLKNPVETKLLNATKISGRTAKKLGIGFFNAITRAEYATIEDDVKREFKVQTNPLTNYNIMVLDQALKHNSSIAMINTNVWRSGHDYDANVTAMLWDLYDKNVDWNVWGKVAHSRLIGYEAPGKTYAGNMYNLFLGKFKGRFNFDVHRLYADNKYNQRDMGYFTNNNYVTHGFYAGYKWVEPKGFYNRINLNLNGNYSQLNTPRTYQYVRFSGNINGQLKSLWYTGFSGDVQPGSNDYYESRMEGRVVKRPASWAKGFWINTNSAKRYSASFELYNRVSRKFKTNNTDLSMTHNYRFGDRLNVGISSSLEFYNRDYGFAFIPDTRDSVVMGLRDRRTAENVVNVKYSFNNKMGITFRLRHYWSKVDYHQFYNLKPDGTAEALSMVNKNPDINVNLFNIDMNYTWQFAPGSFINITWKTASELYDQLVREKYYKNLRSTLSNPQAINFSVKLIYFLDYLSIKGKTRSME